MSSRKAISGVFRNLLPTDGVGFDCPAELAWLLDAGELISPSFHD